MLDSPTVFLTLTTHWNYPSLQKAIHLCTKYNTIPIPPIILGHNQMRIHLAQAASPFNNWVTSLPEHPTVFTAPSQLCDHRARWPVSGGLEDGRHRALRWCYGMW